VGEQRQRPYAALRALRVDLVELLCALPGDESDIGTLARKCQRNRPSVVAAGARYECGFAFESHVLPLQVLTNVVAMRRGIAGTLTVRRTGAYVALMIAPLRGRSEP